MATNSESRVGPDFQSEKNAANPHHRGSLTGWLLGAMCLAGAVGLGTVVVPQITGLGDEGDTSDVATHRISNGKLVLTVTEDGNVESGSNVDVKCKIAGGATILWIVEDGKEVLEGDVIVKLDQSTIDDQFNAQRIIYEKAVAARIQAEEEFEAAKISVKEYGEGLYIKELQDLQAQVTIAMENLRGSQNVLQHTEKMSRKGFVTPLQLEADHFAVQRAELELKSAQTAERVLVKFTKAKTLKTLEATRDANEARMRSERAACDLEKIRLDRLKAQLKECVIKAPAKGMVVWANEQGRRRSQQVPSIEEGAIVREQQTIIRLPDLSKMQVRVTIHESKVEQIEPGMSANIIILDRKLEGKVVSIANRPEPGSWFSSEVKQYAAVVAIEGEPTGLKPGMTAEVEILIASLDDVLSVPVQAVVEQGDNFYSWAQTKEGPERRPVVLGLTNDKMIEIKDGLAEGEQVILNPRAFVSEARKETSEDENDASKKKEHKSAGKPEKSNKPNSKPKKPETQKPDTQKSPDKQAPSTTENKPAADTAQPAKQQTADGGGGQFDLKKLDADGDGRISQRRRFPRHERDCRDSPDDETTVVHRRTIQKPNRSS